MIHLLKAAFHSTRTRKMCSTQAYCSSIPILFAMTKIRYIAVYASFFGWLRFLIHCRSFRFIYLIFYLNLFFFHVSLFCFVTRQRAHPTYIYHISTPFHYLCHFCNFSLHLSLCLSVCLTTLLPSECVECVRLQKWSQQIDIYVHAAHKTTSKDLTNKIKLAFISHQNYYRARLTECILVRSVFVYNIL